MRILLPILALALFLGCTTYKPGDLNGKWVHPSEPIELWIQDTLAISYQFEEQFLILMNIDYKNDLLTFTYIEPWKGSTYKDRVIDMTQEVLELELQNPGNMERRRYHRLTNELPKISTDYEMNYELYESYMRSKINNR